MSDVQPSPTPGPASIPVEVRLFATFRQGRFKKETLDLPADAAVADLLALLRIEPKEVSILLVNGQESRPDRRLASGDAVSLFPGVGGG